jgi:hypothetical protein
MGATTSRLERVSPPAGDGSVKGVNSSDMVCVGGKRVPPPGTAGHARHYVRQYTQSLLPSGSRK